MPAWCPRVVGRRPALRLAAHPQAAADVVAAPRVGAFPLPAVQIADRREGAVEPGDAHRLVAAVVRPRLARAARQFIAVGVVQLSALRLATLLKACWRDSDISSHMSLKCG